MLEKQIILRDHLVNYYAVESESPAAKTVIFLHGFRANGMIWMAAVEGLLRFARDDGLYNIYSIDLPGFGKSEFPQQPFRLQDYAEIVAEFVSKLNLRNPFLVGHSFGGRVAIKLAAEHPELLRKLVLVDCGGFRKIEWKRGLTTFLAKVTGPAFALPLLKTLRPRIYNILGADDFLALPELKNTFINIINEDVLGIAPKIMTPTLIVWGKDDQEVPLSFGQKMHDLVPASKFLVLEKAGHFSFLDKPEEFVKELRDFLNA